MVQSRQIVEQLRARLQELESDCHSLGDTVSTGSGDLDQFLGGGFERGSLVEWIGTRGSGATTFALLAAREACGGRGILAVLDYERDFYPPAAAALGIDLDRTIVVQPRSTQDYHWSLIQVLTSRCVAAVLCWPDRANQRMLRRLQLAAERGGTLALLVRPPRVLHEPSWAKVRLLVEPQSTSQSVRRWRITHAGSSAQQSAAIELEMDDETGKIPKASSLPVAARLVGRAPWQTASRA